MTAEKKGFLKDLFFASCAFGMMFLLLISAYHSIFMSYQNAQLEKFKQQLEFQVENINSLNIDETFDLQNAGYGDYQCQSLQALPPLSEDEIAQLNEEQTKTGQVKYKHVVQPQPQQIQPIQPVAQTQKTSARFYSTDANAYFKDVIFPENTVINLLRTDVVKDENGEKSGILTVSMPYVIVGVYEYYLNKMPNLGWKMVSYKNDEHPELTFEKNGKMVSFKFIDSGTLGTITAVNYK